MAKKQAAATLIAAQRTKPASIMIPGDLLPAEVYEKIILMKIRTGKNIPNIAVELLIKGLKSQ